MRSERKTSGGIEFDEFTDAYPNISPHFTFREFADPTTGRVRLAPGFLAKLERLREYYGKPMIVTGGCRSAAHNNWLKRRGYAASPNSLHLMDNPKYKCATCALDIARPNGADLHKLVRIASGHCWTVGIAPTFIHLDQRRMFTELPPVVYTYD